MFEIPAQLPILEQFGADNKFGAVNAGMAECMAGMASPHISAEFRVASCLRMYSGFTKKMAITRQVWGMDRMKKT